ncbi:secretin and TonB N-terminal domain-containing protein [Pseudomonas sp. NPDC089734]|uniref:secretin and TonB N-terminal domain-containing protein n=1 Tax=Pseudomonas sp. NPDC089734 TaxID=3364469 RepID=UPI003809EFE0
MLDIPAQNLASALDAFSRLTGMAVLVDHELTRGRRSLTLKGRYSPQDGLSRLLTGSGLMARYTRADAFTLQVAEVENSHRESGGASGTASLAGNSYAQSIQQAIEKVFCRSSLTRPGSYRALLQVWIGQGGEIQHSRLVASTGNTRRDEALVESLKDVRVGRSAPSSLRQPVTLLLVPDSTGKSMDCKQWEGALGA